MCRRRRWERNDHRRARLCVGIRLFGGEVLAKRVGRREQKREKPSLPAGDPYRRRKGTAVLDAENRAVERDRDVAVVAAAHPWEQRQPRQSEADPQHTRERRRRRQARRLESRQEPRSHRGLCRCLPPILHVRQPQVLPPNRRYLSPNIGDSRPGGRPPSEGVGLRRTAKGPAPQSGPSRSA